MAERTQGFFEGSRLVAASAFAAGVLVPLVLALLGAGEEGTLAANRWLARGGSLFFLLAFVASPLHRRWPGEASRRLLRNRRYLGLSFAAFHMTHLAALVMLASILGDEFFARTSATTLIVGGGGFVLTVAMALTSNDRAVRLLGGAWHRLHGIGMYYLWFVFTVTYAGGIAAQPVLAPVVALFVAGFLLRVTTRKAA